MATMQHKKITVVSIFVIGISQNTKCDNLVGFPKSGHKYGLHGQPCHGGFTAQNISYRLLQIQIVALPKENGKKEGKRGKTQIVEVTVQSKREREIEE